ncbi:HAMP domain-containing histidine kinase [Nocardioides sp. BGMRC 2183]|nr:HAMP domain-containing histidine kinase [Nocardioides sp. BGMRC 2183]
MLSLARVREAVVPRSLTSRLVVTSVALVAIVSLLVAVATAVAMRSYLTGRLDTEVHETLDRATRPLPDGFDFPPGLDPPDIPGQQIGTLTVYLGACGDTGTVLTDNGSGQAVEEEVPADVVDEIGALPSDGAAHTVEVTGWGDYRVVGGTDANGCSVVVGLPLQDVDAAVGSLVRWELALALLGVIAAAIAGNAVVRRQLRPLRQVAATAHEVSELPLAAGEIEIGARVPEELTDPATETGQVGAALNTLLEHVETSLTARHRSEQQVRQFVADASHELRTPLTTIAGYTELARRRGDPETAATALTKVQEESTRMTALVEDLLLLARLDAGRPLAHDDVDLTRLLLEAVDDARVVAPTHRWRVELPEDGTPLGVSGDELRLHQVVTNLLTNARKYTPEGTTITARLFSDGFEVADDGPGFPDSVRDTAFERFTRGDTARRREGGAGLGLALVRAIVQAHGGTVTLRTGPGDTRVRVSLPDTRCIRTT